MSDVTLTELLMYETGLKDGASGRGSRARYRRAVVDFAARCESEAAYHDGQAVKYSAGCECIPLLEDEHIAEAARWRKHEARCRRILARLDGVG